MLNQLWRVYTGINTKTLRQDSTSSLLHTHVYIDIQDWYTRFTKLGHWKIWHLDWVADGFW